MGAGEMPQHVESLPFEDLPLGSLILPTPYLIAAKRSLPI